MCTCIMHVHYMCVCAYTPDYCVHCVHCVHCTCIYIDMGMIMSCVHVYIYMLYMYIMYKTVCKCMLLVFV